MILYNIPVLMYIIIGARRGPEEPSRGGEEASNSRQGASSLVGEPAKRYSHWTAGGVAEIGGHRWSEETTLPLRRGDWRRGRGWREWPQLCNRDCTGEAAL